MKSLSGSPFRRRLLAHYARFALLSGIGWLLALLLLWVGVHVLALRVWTANAIGDAVAITFVFFASPQVAFGTQNLRKMRSFFLWLLWQVVHIALISWALDSLTSMTSAVLQPMLGNSLEVAIKIAITPVTLTLNFVVVRWLIHRHIH